MGDPLTPKLDGMALAERPAAQTSWPEYSVWRGMISRCHNPRSKSFSAYGARGVAVAAAWRASFSTFISHVGPRPTAQHSIDRYPDPAGNYEPGNVRWATAREQASNKRVPLRTRVLQGVTRTVEEWLKVAVVRPGCFLSRINGRRMSLGVALTRLESGEGGDVDVCRVVLAERRGAMEASLDGSDRLLAGRGRTTEEAIGRLVLLHGDVMGIRFRKA